MIPLYFGECFGWLHPANGGRGVVLCSAFGVEELCTHRFMRQLAEQTAAAGMPTLRFDYQGTGDSLGSDLDPDRVAQWLSSIRSAIEWLREETGVAEVTLVGFRLGGLLAAQVAAQVGDISQLALLAPAISGKSYLREMKALSAVIGQSTGTQPADASTSTDRDCLEIAGFVLTRETIASLEDLDLLKLERPPAARVLLLGRPAAPGDARLANRLRELGCLVEHDVLPGYAEMEWNSTVATLPDNAFDGLVRWLSDALPPTRSRLPTGTIQQISSAQWREDPAQFGDDGTLFGIRCRPTAPSQPFAVLFVNHGSNHHIGWARMFVHLARRLAAQGITSLRMDIAGLGDSPAHPGQVENQLYYRGSQRDVYAALDWLQAQGYEKCAVIGHCAGAYLGFFSATHDVRISKLVLLNLQRFFWRRGDSLQIAMRTGFRSTSWYLSKIFDRRIWQRALSGKINLSGITKTLVRRLMQRYGATLADVSNGEPKTPRSKHTVVKWFRQFSERGTKVLLVYSAEDGGLDEIALHGGSRAKKIRKLPNVNLRIIDGADHNITARSAYEEYAKILEDYLIKVPSD